MTSSSIVTNSKNDTTRLLGSISEKKRRCNHVTPRTHINVRSVKSDNMPVAGSVRTRSDIPLPGARKIPMCITEPFPIGSCTSQAKWLSSSHPLPLYSRRSSDSNIPGSKNRLMRSHNGSCSCSCITNLSTSLLMRTHLIRCIRLNRSGTFMVHTKF